MVSQNDKNDWTLEKRLNLESRMLNIYYPIMCLDMLPATGIALNLQHILLSERKLKLNLLKKIKYTSSIKMGPNLLNFCNKSTLSSEPQTSSNCMVSWTCILL